MSNRVQQPPGPATPYRVLICGSNYGRSYLAPLVESAGRYQPVALLARGSDRSRRLAGRYGLALCRTVEELPEEIDFACAALPAAADDVVLALLDRGLHVLCEHPRRSAFLNAAYRAAARGGVRFQINGHFADLPAPLAFVRRYRQLAAESAPRFVDVTAQERSLYAALDILGRALPGLGAVTLEHTHSSNAFVTMEGRLRGEQGRGEQGRDGRADPRASFQVHTPAGNPADGSPRYLVDLRIAAGFDRGVLSLLSVAGPVIWNANLGTAAEDADPLFEAVSGHSMTVADLRQARRQANRTALERLADEIESGVAAPEVSRDHTLEVARIWQHLGDQLGRESSPA